MCHKFRNGADSGVWASLLLPFCFLPMALKSNSFTDKFMFAALTELSVFHAIGRIIYFENFLKVNYHFAFNAIFSLPASAVISYFTSADFIVIYSMCHMTALSYSYLILKLLKHCSASFTLGEVQTVAQGIVTFVLKVLLSLKQLNQNMNRTMHEEGMLLLQLLLLGLLLLVCSLYLVPTLRSGFEVIFISFGCAMTMIVIWTAHVQKNLLTWFLEFCTINNKRMYLFSFWLIMLVASILFVVQINQKAGYRASTLDRKYFHLISDAVFISGIIFDVQFLCFASIIVFGAFIILEIYRLLHVPIIGPVIEQAFKIFLDEKDSGLLILTHIYLLIGCSSPIWLSSYYVSRNKYHICLLSGIISVGIGDTFAAAGGTLYGKHQWKGSLKTLEGTACAAVVQLICSSVFLYLGHPFSMYNVSLIVISVVLTSLLEAMTTQVDNLVLPLFMFSFLSWIE